MWLSLILLGLLFAVAVKQATQGLFSSLIMVVLTVCCAAAALGSYEYVAGQWIGPMWRPDYALPVALAATFGVPLLILRLVFDKLIRRSCLLPAMVERVGAGLLALVSAMTIVGVAAISLQMVPFANGSIIGFARLPVVSVQDSTGSEADRAPKDQASESRLWLSPDRFAAGLGEALLDGAIGSAQSFGDHYPDLLSTIGWMGAVPAGTATYAPTGSISVKAASKIDSVYKMTPANIRAEKPALFDVESPSSGNEFQLVRVHLGAEARDANKSHAFTLRQFRLVGTRDQVVRQFPAIALRLDGASTEFTRHVRSVEAGGRFWPVFDNVYAPDNDGDVEVVFEVSTGFQPSFVEYRRGARAKVTLGKPAAPTASSRPAPTPSTASARPVQPAPRVEPPTEESSGSSRSGRRSRRSRESAETTKEDDTPKPGARVRGVAAKGKESFFGDELPMTLTSYRKINNAEVSRGKLSSGYLVAEVDRQAEGTDPPVSKFDVPQDKRLLQLSSTRLKAGSTLGGALAYAVTTVQNYYVEDDRGQRHVLVGKYVIAKDNDTKIFEVQYFSEPVGAIGGIGKFTRINEKNLKSDDVFVLLFLVDPGVRIVAFNTGGAASRRDDLSLSDLVAPE